MGTVQSHGHGWERAEAQLCRRHGGSPPCRRHSSGRMALELPAMHTTTVLPAAETLAKKNKSTSLNKLQRALCPSKETRRGLQPKKVESMVPSRGTSLTSPREAQGVTAFQRRFGKGVWPQANQMAFPWLFSRKNLTQFG